MCGISLIRELVKWGIAYGEDLEIGALFYKSNELGESRRQVERVVGAIDIAMTETSGHIDERGEIREQWYTCFWEDVWCQLEGWMNGIVEHVG